MHARCVCNSSCPPERYFGPKPVPSRVLSPSSEPSLSCERPVVAIDLPPSRDTSKLVGGAREPGTRPFCYRCPGVIWDFTQLTMTNGGGCRMLLTSRELRRLSTRIRCFYMTALGTAVSLAGERCSCTASQRPVNARENTIVAQSASPFWCLVFALTCFPDLSIR